MALILRYPLSEKHNMSSRWVFQATLLALGSYREERGDGLKEGSGGEMAKMWLWNIDQARAHGMNM